MSVHGKNCVIIHGGEVTVESDPCGLVRLVIDSWSHTTRYAYTVDPDMARALAILLIRAAVQRV